MVEVVSAAKAGCLIVTSAGNEHADARDFVPNCSSDSITVGALETKDQVASFSNWGSRVDIWAPGRKILSASHKDDSARRAKKGTSIAAPHVAGLAAYFALVDGVEGVPELRKKCWTRLSRDGSRRKT